MLLDILISMLSFLNWFCQALKEAFPEVLLTLNSPKVKI